jgi:hypothetical protein
MSELAFQAVGAKLRAVLLAARHLPHSEGSLTGKRVQQFLEA